MIELSAGEATAAVSGTLHAGKPRARFRGAGIDSRALQPGELFFCIRGERFDGHDFIADVAARKAAGIVASDAEKIPAALKAGGPFVILVRDTLAALQELARHHRKTHPARVVGITGTNGKSTTKEMTAALAETRFATLRNKGNLNNHIGLPLTLLQLAPEHQVAVLEMGMSARGEIRRLAEIAAPQIGIITNISEAHMLQLKTVRDVQAAKGELFEALTADHTAIVNADDPLVLELARALKARRITFGVNHPADLQALSVEPDANEGFHVTVRLLDRQFSLRVPLPGVFNVHNALAAMAAGHALGLTPEDMIRGFAAFKPLGQRLEVRHHNSMTLINDTYNANPRSMREAMKMLGGHKTAGRRFFIMGNMLELGELSLQAHRQMGNEAVKLPIDFLLAVGDEAGQAVAAAREEGMAESRALAFPSHEEAVVFLKKHARSGDCLLFKGSRGSKMEKVIEGLTRPEGS